LRDSPAAATARPRHRDFPPSVADYTKGPDDLQAELHAMYEIAHFDMEKLPTPNSQQPNTGVAVGSWRLGVGA
jgi:hypothetical protein